MFFTERAKLQELMQTTRLPMAYQNRDYVVDEGGLLSMRLISLQAFATRRNRWKGF